MNSRMTPTDSPTAVTETQIPLPEGLTEEDRSAYEAELKKLMISDAARKVAKQSRLEQEAASLDTLQLVGVDELVATEPEGSEWLVEGLMPYQGSLMVAAAFKTGKTTLALNMVHALTTGKPFLGEFHVPEPMKVAYFDLELGSRLARKWFMDMQPDMAMVKYADLKGMGRKLDVRVDAVFDHLVQILRSNSIDVVIIDPLSALCSALGINENSNEDVRPLMDRLDALVAEAGCKGLMVIHHTGKDETRGARGASAFQDWSSVNGYLSKAQSGQSKFHAKGRDVDVKAVELSYDSTTRMLAVEHSGADTSLWFSSNRGKKLTIHEVVSQLNVSKPTARKMLEENGWEITEPANGKAPAVWECLHVPEDPFA